MLEFKLLYSRGLHVSAIYKPRSPCKNYRLAVPRIFLG